MISTLTDTKRPLQDGDTHSIAGSEATTTFDTRSIAPSEMTLTESDASHPPQYSDYATPDPNASEHNPATFTAAGRPMPERTYPASLMGGVENTLPVRFKDTSFVPVPIPQSDIDAALAAAPSSTAPPSYCANVVEGASQALAPPSEQPRRASFLLSLRKAKSKDKEPKKPAFRTIKMTRGEYLAYFAKNERGEFICKEPRESGAWMQVIRMRMEDAELQAQGRTDTRFANGRSGFTGGIAGIGFVGGM